MPAPKGNPDAPLRALIFDSKFDDYAGVVVYVRVVDGLLKVGQKIRLMAGGTEHEVISLGRFRPSSRVVESGLRSKSSLRRSKCTTNCCRRKPSPWSRPDR